MNDIKMGDIVFLKSDGPKMVVQSFSNLPGDTVKYIECVWFGEYEKKALKQFFSIKVLTKIESISQTEN